MFYPSDARIPEALQTDEFLVRPLRATDMTLDYDAVISSRAELLLGSGGTWPREGFTFLHVIFIAQQIEECQIRLFEEVGMLLLYTLKPRQPFLYLILAYLLDKKPSGSNM